MDPRNSYGARAATRVPRLTGYEQAWRRYRIELRRAPCENDPRNLIGSLAALQALVSRVQP